MEHKKGSYSSKTERETHRQFVITKHESKIEKMMARAAEAQKVSHTEDIERPISTTNLTRVLTKEKLKRSRYISFCDIEVFLFLEGLCISYYISFVDNLLYRRKCQDQFGESRSEYQICYDLDRINVSGNYYQLMAVLNSALSYKVSMIFVRLLTEFCASVLLCPWSDIYGRKTPILLALVGLQFELVSYFFRGVKDEEFFYSFYISNIFAGIFGGRTCIMAMSYSYVSEHSSVDYRTLRYTFADTALVLGRWCGEVAFEKAIFLSVLAETFLVVFLARLLCILWVAMALDDDQFEARKDPLLEKISAFFSSRVTGGCLNALSKFRRNCGTHHLRLILVSMLPAFFAYYLVGREVALPMNPWMFQWARANRDLIDGLDFSHCLVEMVGMLLVQFVTKSPDSAVGFIGFLSLYFFCVVSSFASHHMLLVIALCLAMFGAYVPVVLRSTLSKITDDTEKAGAFMALSLSEQLSAGLGVAVHAQVRSLLAVRHPDLTYLVVATALLLPVATFLLEMISIDTECLFQRCFRTVIILPPSPDEEENTEG